MGLGLDLTQAIPTATFATWALVWGDLRYGRPVLRPYLQEGENSMRARPPSDSSRPSTVLLSVVVLLGTVALGGSTTQAPQLCCESPSPCPSGDIPCNLCCECIPTVRFAEGHVAFPPEIELAIHANGYDILFRTALLEFNADLVSASCTECDNSPSYTVGWAQELWYFQ